MSGTKITADAFRSIAAARRSCARFQKDKLIPQKVLSDIVNTSLTSPSGFNLQPTNVILVQNQTIKEELANTAMLGPGNIFRTRDSSAIAVFLSDLEPHKRIDRIMELEKESGVRTKPYLASLPVVSTFLMGQGRVATLMKQTATDLMSPAQPMPSIDPIQSWSYKNTSLMVQTFVFSATSHGLSTCLMEGYDSRRMKDVLKIPDRYDIPLVCGIGYEYEGDAKGIFKRAPRLNANEVFFSDTFGQQLDLSSLENDDDTRDEEDKEAC